MVGVRDAKVRFFGHHRAHHELRSSTLAVLRRDSRRLGASRASEDHRVLPDSARRGDESTGEETSPAHG